MASRVFSRTGLRRTIVVSIPGRHRCPLARYSTSVGRTKDTALPNASGETILEKIIVDSIKATGPIPVSKYMQMCLSHPTEGYYSKGDVFGARGDFVTSPEITQIFGELLGIWLLSRWIANGKPKRTRLVELGPGRGTLMDDILRALSHFREFKQSFAAVHLVETSQKLRDVQKDKLAERIASFGSPIDISWYDRIEDLPRDGSEYSMVVAHEFFDALPIHILKKTSEGFRELFVDLQRSPSLSPTLPSKPRLGLAVSPVPNVTSAALSSSSKRFDAVPVGHQLEVSPASWTIARAIGELVSAPGGGAGLIVDYGDARAFESSFRGFRKHQIVDVFDQPGCSDLTANVDFAYLKEALEPVARSHGPIPQRDFLINLGMGTRLEALLGAAKTEERRADIVSAAKRLVDPLGMGTQYKVMGITSRTVGSDSKEEAVFPFSEPALGTNRGRGEAEGKSA